MARNPRGGDSGSHLIAAAWFRRRCARWPVAILSLVCAVIPINTAAADSWASPSRQLAQKIVAITGPGAVAVAMENRSSLGRKDYDAVNASLRAELELLGAHPVPIEQAAASVQVTLSENPSFYVWVAEVRQGNRVPVIAIVSLPHLDKIGVVQDSMPMSLRKIPLWAQQGSIMDVAVLDENSSPQHIAVLDGEKVEMYRQSNGKWLTEEALAIPHEQAWPRDLRGRLLAAKDHLFDVYLPGVFCQTTSGTPLKLNCRQTDDPWPLPNAARAESLRGFYAASRNFFTGALTPAVGKLTNVDKFYSAASLPRANYVLWLFAGTDGQIHLVDGVTEQSAKLNWGSDIVSVRTGCGAGWQVLATAKDDGSSGDSVRAYEIADRDPAPVSAALEFAGKITALLPDVKYDSAIAIVHEPERGEYEAFRVAVVCGD